MTLSTTGRRRSQPWLTRKLKITLAASTPRRSILLSVGWPISRQASGLAASISAFVRSLIASSWAWPSRCASSMTSRRQSRPRSWLGGDEGGGLGGEHGRSVGGPSAECRHDVVVDPSRARRRVGQVDEGVAGLVERGDGSAGGGRLPGADFARDDPERPLAGAPGDAGDRLGVGGVAVQHGRGEVLAERGPGEPVVVFQVDHQSSRVVMPAAAASAAVSAASRARAAASRAASASSGLQPPASRPAAMRSRTAALAVR